MPALTHLDRLEAESLHIMREVVAEAENPVFLYSVGKDSSVMLHLAAKAFYPAPPPFPFLHIESGWDFQDLLRHRDLMAQRYGFDLIVARNEDAERQGINPFDTPTGLYAQMTLIDPLKAALDRHGFDAAFGGARRDEEKARAKERIFSFRSATHGWDPKNQRPELWNLYNAKKAKGETIRVFPISNWTELDIWQYILRENIPIVPLYLAAERPTIERDGMLLVVDDDRMRLTASDVIIPRRVRFRTLGCYPLTGATESSAQDLSQVIQEMLLTTTSERQGRAVDHDEAASMEKKKQAGYF
ncbi:sulfate adenylyltransferase subunit CysD [Novosphingobium flavum]|uniref:Sulfate adenylyltransferase subunit 2 n=2 Tax=Novosphingobium aerophilum TaxID=2839843 RepID=A0A7X1F5T8_9SPHN|nr:sulfate adenylyltransferase subunit CysD [Novosphingobium aerophilum]MBC2650893.1 sulfate adenylyltransferase subunit CysD [Novosphingobium aerophilum]MBC2663630.1 sulfate adenylyltransferase subunit CysD [Novosphingobium aerophilum]